MCAAIMKNWREAATLILVQNRKRIRRRMLDPTAMATPTPTPAPQDDELDLLVLKRSSKSSFMPDLYVFPGGTADKCDFSRKWLPLFDAKSPASAENRFGFAKTAGQNAPMFQRQSLQADRADLPSEIAFRICAIRETFEESGVLIARSVDESCNQYSAGASYPYSFGKNHESKVEEWRQKVMKNPGEFVTMCEKLDIVPNIWSLFDWANWLTPVFDGPKSSNKRFDAAFYICCLQDRPYVSVDADETVHSQWLSPRQVMEDYAENRVQLAPPQIYEATRLMNFSTVEELLQFLKKRAGQPVERWMPVRIQCADAIIFTFPGDSLYPEPPDYDGTMPMMQKTESLEELTSSSERLHRAVIALPPKDGTAGDNRRFQLQCNIELSYGHVAPKLDDLDQEEVMPLLGKPHLGQKTPTLD